MTFSRDVYIPQVAINATPTTVRRATYLAWCVAIAVAAGVLALVVAAPLAADAGRASLAFSLYRAFAFACHQIPERSFHLHGVPLAVCARCWGVYVGFGAGVLLYPLLGSFARPAAPWRGWLLLAAVPTSVDFLLGFSGIWENTHWSRALTGALLGTVSAFYVVPGVLELSLRRRRPAHAVVPR